MNNTEYYSRGEGIGIHRITLTGDINFPPYEELDYTIKKIKNLIEKYDMNSQLINRITSFDASDLELGNLENKVKSTAGIIAKLFGADSSLNDIYSILKSIESKLRELDDKYDLYLSLGYLNSLDESGNFDILGERASETERRQIIDQINNFVGERAGEYAVGTEDEEAILKVAISTYLNTTSGDSQELYDIIRLLLVNYAGVTCFTRREGGLFIQREDYYTIGIPENYRGQQLDVIIFFDAEITTYHPTLGQEKYWRQEYSEGTCLYQEDIIDTMMSQNPNTIVVASHFGIGKVNANEMLSILDNIGVNSSHILLSGFSAGGNMAITTAEEIIKNHSNLGNPELFLIDCNHTTQVQSSIDYLGSQGIKCTLLHKLDNENIINRYYNHIINSGMDFSVINLNQTWTPANTNESFHLGKKSQAINEDYFGYLLGNAAVPTDYDESGKEHPNPDYLHLNPSTHEFEHITPDKTTTI